ncbi:MAG TPA: Eco57I restriction-modification methylase domain-containing protein [Nitrospiraceae bacterium]|nr:Eco57I restriction-modification methylase domain-containing protein [Nitrospiraceae bacterium]
MLTEIDRIRLRVSAETEAKKKSQFGQYLTPFSIAKFMANLFTKNAFPVCRLLDPGAGIGSLTGAFLERFINGGFDCNSVEVTACEIDSGLREDLLLTLSSYQARIPFLYEIVPGDFIENAVNWLQFREKGDFTHAIINPPYKKIRTQSDHRFLLRQIGVETVNLYSAFVALALSLLCPGGQLVAIVPRSFCNGPYYRPFREFVLKQAAIRHLHLFGSRDKAFKDDNVLQENVIIMLERNGRQQDVTVSTSTDETFDNYAACKVSVERIVFPNDPERFIHIPTSIDHSLLELSDGIRYTLSEIGVMVSTGPVVDFRLREHICQTPKSGTVPLLYPSHFSGKFLKWPKEDIKKPNAIFRNAQTEKWLYPTGFYSVVRRFSSKEERRRIVASVVEPSLFHGAAALGFENHLNVFHDHRQGLPESLARGLAVFLNMTAVDDHFRRFNGHTQVNATDLRAMRYPSRKALVALGEWAIVSDNVSQTEIDNQFIRLGS